MKGEENLIPLNQRTKEERRRIAVEGGKASGEARRAKKTMRECAELLLSLPVSDRRKWNKMSRMYLEAEDIDNKMSILVGLLLAAQSGDVSAAKELRSIIGEDKEQDMTSMEKLDEVLKALDKEMSDG